MNRLLLSTLAAVLIVAAPASAAKVAVPWQKGKPQFQTLRSGPIADDNQDEANSDQVHSAIAGGSLVAQGSAPYAVRLEVQPSTKRRPDAFCSGALIAPRYVLTAAHCIAMSPLEYQKVVGKVRFKVRFANVAGKPTVAVTSANYWRNFSLLSFGTAAQSDLAILQLASDGPTAPVALSSLTNSVLSSPVRELGYGPRQKKEKDGMQSSLYQGNMRFAAPSVCSGSYRGQKLSVFEKTEFCTRATPPSANAGACHGDSGGPALSTSNGALIGVTSWSMVENCDVAASRRETVFARADTAKSWIQRQTGAALFGEPAQPQDLTVPNAARSWVYDMNSRQVVVATSAREGETDEAAASLLRETALSAGAYYLENDSLDGYASAAPVTSTVADDGETVRLATAGSNGECYVVYQPTSRGGINPRTFNIFCKGGSWQATTMVAATARTNKKVYTATAVVETDANENGISLRLPASWRKKPIRTISVETYGRFYNSLDNGTSADPEAVTLRLR